MKYAPLLILLCLTFACFAAAAGEKEERFQFVIVGDRTGTADQKVFDQCIDEMKRFHPNLAVNVGDMVEGMNPNVEDDWRTVKETLKKLDCPVHYLPGNNDYWNEESKALYEKETGAPTYYSFDYRQAHFVILDNATINSWDQMDEKQLTWLKGDLEEHRDAAITFCLFHKPFWFGIDLEKDRLHGIFRDAGVDVVLSGHYHSFARTLQDGIEYVLIGSSGGHSGQNQAAGQFYGYGLATVRGDKVDIAMLQHGSVLPETALSLDEVKLVQEIERTYLDIDPVEFPEGSKNVKTSARVMVENILEEPFTQTITWSDMGEGWRVEPREKAVTFPAKSKSYVDFSIRIPEADKLYPLPKFHMEYPTRGWGRCTVEGVMPLMRSKTLKKAKSGPAIDGRLDDACWSVKSRLGDLYGHGGETASTEPTHVFISQDAKNLYIGVRCVESELETIKSPAKERDNPAVFSGDWVMIFLDPHEDDKEICQLVVGPNGIYVDRKVNFTDEGPKRNYDWNADWTVKTGREASAWTLELSLPWDQLDLKPSADAGVGFNIGRMQSRANAYATWQTFLSWEPRALGKLKFK